MTTADIAAIPMQMVDAWNRGDGAGFAAAFTDTADFIAFEGTHLTGYDEIVAFHQKLFDTVLKGSKLVGEVKFARILDPDWAVMHAWATTILPGESAPSPSRDSMQLFVLHRGPSGWRAEAMLNARQLTLERQAMLDRLVAG